MNLSPAELAVFGTLGGVAITAFASITTTLINKRTEERKHLREQIVKTSLEYWQKHYELVKSANGKLTQVVPLDAYLVHITAVMTAVMDKKLTPENVPLLLEEAHKISKAAYEQAEKDPTPTKGADHV